MNNDQLIEAGRQLFTELEAIIKSHRESNSLPILGATDIFVAGQELLKVAQELNKRGIEIAPTLSSE